VRVVVGLSAANGNLSGGLRMTWTVTIDNGSTFTDGCLFADGRVWSVKVLTTLYDLMRCFVEVFRRLAQVAGLENEAALLRRVEEVRYSTTSGTNALLVRKGVRVGLITSQEGADDSYGLRRTAPDLMDALVGDRVVGLHVGETAGETLGIHSSCGRCVSCSTKVHNGSWSLFLNRGVAPANASLSAVI
jgi:hypothetical protein